MNIRTKVPSLGVVIITKVWMASLVPGLHLLLVKSVGDVDGLVRPAMQWPPAWCDGGTRMNKQVRLRPAVQANRKVHTIID